MKVRLNVTIDHNLVELAKKEQLNLSEIFNNHLKIYLNQNKEDGKEEIKWS